MGILLEIFVISRNLEAYFFGWVLSLDLFHIETNVTAILSGLSHFHAFPRSKTSLQSGLLRCYRHPQRGQSFHHMVFSGVAKLRLFSWSGIALRCQFYWMTSGRYLLMFWRNTLFHLSQLTINTGFGHGNEWWLYLQNSVSEVLSSLYTCFSWC